MNTITIQELKDKAIATLQVWAEDRINGLVAGNPGLAMASVYLKRGVKNYLAREKERIGGMIDDASMFICDANGNMDADALFSDFMSVFRNMGEISFGKGLIHGTIGKGVIRFILPENPITGLLFGNTGAIRITEADLMELKKMLVGK